MIPMELTKEETLQAISLAVREFAMDNMYRTISRYNEVGAKRVYYLSIEYLIGRSLENNLHNLGLFKLIQDIHIEGMPSLSMEEISRKWYKEMSVYHIWCRSFCDSNGDGIGDLPGVYSKLDYIQSLGVDGIWFSPIYPSPNCDYGYDISDYKNIHPDYGTLDDFKMILDGEVDYLPEQAFLSVGTIDEAIEKGKKLLAEI